MLLFCYSGVQFDSLDDSRTDTSEESEALPQKSNLEKPKTDSMTRISIKLHHFKFDIRPEHTSYNPCKINHSMPNITNFFGNNTMLNTTTNHKLKSTTNRGISNRSPNCNGNLTFKNPSSIDPNVAVKPSNMVLMNSEPQRNHAKSPSVIHDQQKLFNATNSLSSTHIENNLVKINRQVPLRKKPLSNNDKILLNTLELNGHQTNGKINHNGEHAHEPRNKMSSPQKY